MSRIIQAPEMVRRKALALGAEGEAWLEGLGALIDELEAQWNVRVGNSYLGGSAGYVADAVTADGVDAVVKLAIPDGLEGQAPFATELRTLLLGNGRGYVEVLAYDEDRKAMLQERLGRPLSELGLSVGAQIKIIASLLQPAWRPVPEPTRLRTGGEQARSLAEFMAATWEELGRPCGEQTIERALSYADARRKAFDPETAVLIHGDAHPANVLEDRAATAAPRRFKLIDPDGMTSERAHDLAIPLRGWSSELLAGVPSRRGVEWCSRLSRLTGVDRRPIWEWAFIERVSTGLYLMQLGDAPSGEQFLKVAAIWTELEL